MTPPLALLLCTMYPRLFFALGALAAVIPLKCIGFAGPNVDLSRIEGVELKRAVSVLAARNHRPLSYRALWDVLKEADSHPSRSGFVVGLYSRTAIAAECTEGKAPASCDLTWNREHVWPKSKAFPRREQWAHTDAHHIAAEVVRCNSLRGNLDFGEGGQISQECSSRRGRGVGANWEPSDAAKGQVARMLFYVAARYEGDPVGDKTPNLELVNRPTKEGEPFLGNLCTLLRWNQAFPVTKQERGRHAVVARYQGNRNPFVEQPGLANRIWAGQCSGR